MSESRSNKLPFLILIAACSIAALFIGTQLNIPTPAQTDHQSAMDAITVKDTTVQVVLTPVLIRSGQTRALSMLPLSFTGQLQYSFWELRSDPNDGATVYATATVWGPSPDGEYYFMLGRLTMDELTVSTPQWSKVWAKNSDIGFAYAYIA